MKKLNKVLFLLFTSWCTAQNYTGNLQPIVTDGLTKIVVEPELISALQNNWDYFRILDSKGNEVPYALNTRTISGRGSVIKDLKILSKSSIPNVSTSIIIANESRIKFDLLTLTIANTEVVKTYSISGSDDQNQWYGLVNNETVDGLYSSTATDVKRDFSFPLNNYKFLRIDFVDKKSLPIQVLSASVTVNLDAQDLALVELKDFQQTISQNKSEKTTIIDLQFKTKQVINGLKFNISDPQFYRRNADIVVNKTRLRNRKQENYRESVTSFQLNSKTQNQFRINEIFEKNITIEIENQDSSPLVIDEIKLLQESVALISELKAGENYTIVVDSTLSAPKYDLSYLGDIIQTQFSETQITNLEKYNSTNKEKTEDLFWKTPLFMWICIGFALVVIAYFSKGLLKDLGSNQ